jgi:outer membrane protein insertion porin family
MERLILSGVTALLIFYAAHPAMAQSERVIEKIEIRKNRSISKETIKLYIQTREGDIYREEQVQRDFQAVLAQGFFDEFESRVFVEEGPKGGVVLIFSIIERPIILDIVLDGLKSVQESDFLQRLRERRIGVSKQSLYDPYAVENARRVLQELLAEKGRPNARIDVREEPVSKASVVIYFSVNEGRHVRIAKIDFEGNRVFSDRALRKSMRLVKESSPLTLFNSKDIYDRRKLDEDLQRVIIFMNEKGYLRSSTGEPKIEPAGEIGLPIPLIGRKSDGINITIPVKEGRQYTLGKIAVQGNTIFTEKDIVAVSGLKTGEVASLKVIREGVYERLRKLYGRSGYIQAVPELRPEYNESAGTVDFTIDIEEGKPFIIRRIFFQGNNITRDNVMRREILVNESELFNQELFDLSLLRLNQLDYFEEIKEQDVQYLTDALNGTVDIVLKVKEKGRQKISFSGGLSGAGGSFIGLTYSTNNLFGYGESLALDLQFGNRQRSVSVSFTEPYLTGRPISAGVSFFSSNLKFLSSGLSSGFLTGGAGGAALNDRFDQSLFTRSTTGFGLNLSAPLSLLTRKSLKYTQFTKIGLNYSFSSTKITDPEVNLDSDPANNIVVSFRQPDIITSTITPSLIYNTLNNPIDPTKGKSLSASLSLSGLGGDVKTIYPSLEVKYFTPVIKRDRPQVFGMRLLAEHISSFGSAPATNSLSFIGGVPVFNRFFLGGEDSIRGFNVRSISPVAEVDQSIATTNVRAINVLKNRALPVIRNNRQRLRGIDRRVLDKFTFNNTPIGDQLFPLFTPIGADTQLLYNVEYRIPIAGPLSMAFFADAGTAFNMASLKDQSLVSDPANRTLNRDPNLTALDIPSTIILNPRGRIASQKEIDAARTPEMSGKVLPKGFRLVSIQGDFISNSAVRLSRDLFVIIYNFRA